MTAAVARAFGWAALRLSAWFALVFYGADALAAQRGAPWRLYFDWELAMPYWPAAWPVYFSVLALPFGVPLVATGTADVRRWERRMALAVGIAGIVFVALPAQIGYGPRPDGAWVLAAGQLAGTYNLLPSLHVALGLLTLAALWPRVGAAARAWLALWGALLLPSVLLTHQHHVPDVLAGIALAAAVARMPVLRS